jgi:hypothetical protein
MYCVSRRKETELKLVAWRKIQKEGALVRRTIYGKKGGSQRGFKEFIETAERGMKNLWRTKEKHCEGRKLRKLRNYLDRRKLRKYGKL